MRELKAVAQSWSGTMWICVYCRVIWPDTDTDNTAIEDVDGSHMAAAALATLPDQEEGRVDDAQTGQ